MSQSVPSLLRAYGLRPKKGLGQNFLIEPGALDLIVAAAELSVDDTVVEVGAGLGNLTRALADRAGRVLAIEIDDRLAKVLRSELADCPNVEIIQADILRLFDLGVEAGAYKVVANLPYYVTSAVLRHMLERVARPRLMVVTLQREVAERIVAGPGDMSVLAVSIQFYGQPKIVARIRPGAFYPAPKVDSSVLRIEVSDQPRVTLDEGVDPKGFFRVVRAGFGQKRKMLRNSLSGGLALPPAEVVAALSEVGIDPRRRAQTLSLDEWSTAAGVLVPHLL